MGHNNHEGHNHGMVAVPYSQILQHQREQMHFQNLAETEAKAALKRFMDSLTAEQMLAFNMFLNHLHSNPELISIFKGKASVYLTNIHNVCEECLSTTHSSAEHITATEAAMQQQEREQEVQGAPTDPAQRLIFFNMCRAEDAFNGFNCRNCGMYFSAMEQREQYGRNCPNCDQINTENADLADSELGSIAKLIRYGVAESPVKDGAVACIYCQTEFASLDFRIAQGFECPSCVNPIASEDGPAKES